MISIKQRKQELEKGCGKSWTTPLGKNHWCKSYLLCSTCKVQLKTISFCEKEFLKMIDELRLETNTKRGKFSKERWAGKIDMLLELKNNLGGEDGHK